MNLLVQGHWMRMQQWASLIKNTARCACKLASNIWMPCSNSLTYGASKNLSLIRRYEYASSFGEKSVILIPQYAKVLSIVQVVDVIQNTPFWSAKSRWIPHKNYHHNTLISTFTRVSPSLLKRDNTDTNGRDSHGHSLLCFGGSSLLFAGAPLQGGASCLSTNIKILRDGY